MKLPGSLRNAAERARRRLRPAAVPAVISFPKSGRTWLRVMLDTLGIEAEFSHAGSSEAHRRTADALGEGPRYWRRRRVLFLTRDPRDTAVSAWFQAVRRARVYDGSLSEFLRHPRYGIDKIVRFHLLWLDARPGFRAFLPMQYEALRRNTPQELARAAGFLSGGTVCAEAIAAAVEAGSFERMRALETSGEGAARYGTRLAPADPADPDSFKTRRGTIGGWREHFGPEDAAFADSVLAAHHYRERLAAAGLAFER
jgi:hypothetical protein